MILPELAALDVFNCCQAMLHDRVGTAGWYFLRKAVHKLDCV